MAKHAERRLIRYTPEQMFDLVADIERYPDFLPWCVGARIREHEGNDIKADLAIGFKMYRERFTSHVVLDRPASIHVTYSEGPFRYLQNEWRFEPADGGCAIDFHVEFELRSRLLQQIVEVLFTDAVRRMVGAFEARAQKLYGSAGSRASPPLPA